MIGKVSGYNLESEIYTALIIMNEVLEVKQRQQVLLDNVQGRSGGASVEEVADAMGRLIEDGLIRGWGLSQVDVDVIDRAHRMTPLTAIQNIYSMVERDVESEYRRQPADH